MYHDEIFENSLREVKAESYRALKQEISSMEKLIERFLNNVLNAQAQKQNVTLICQRFNTISSIKK